MSHASRSMRQRARSSPEAARPRSISDSISGNKDSRRVGVPRSHGGHTLENTVAPDAALTVEQ
jgi:hypothetical protein